MPSSTSVIRFLGDQGVQSAVPNHVATGFTQGGTPLLDLSCLPSGSFSPVSRDETSWERSNKHWPILAGAQLYWNNSLKFMPQWYWLRMNKIRCSCLIPLMSRNQARSGTCFKLRKTIFQLSRTDMASSCKQIVNHIQKKVQRWMMVNACGKYWCLSYPYQPARIHSIHQPI